MDLREAGKKKKDLLPTDVRSSSSPPASFTKKTFDPALVVQVDSRKKKIFLNPIQKSLIWEARRKQYQQCLETIVRTLQSHLTPVEKCLHLMHLHETQVIPQRLRLRDDTYEDIFHTFYATATLVRSHPRSSSTGGGGGSAPFSANPSSAYRYGAQQHAATTVEEAEEAEAVAYGEGGEYSGKGGAVSGPSFIFGVPMELATRSAAALTLTSEETMQEWWKMYRYMVDSGTNPTPRILQHVMGLLEQRARWRLGTGKGKRKVPSPTGATTSAAMAPLPPPVPGLAILEAKAHSLMLDADRFHFSPTTYTVNSYIFLCQVCGVMHLALARVCDLWKRWQTQPTSATYAMLLHGFLHQRLPSTGSPPSPTMKEDTTTSAALSVLTSMQSTPITIGLLQEILQVLRYSPDPLSAFTVYKSVMSRRTREGLERPSAAAAAGLIAPTLHTFSILVEVLLRVSEPLSMGKHVKEENRERKQSNEEKNHASAAAETLASSPSSSTAAASFPKHLLTFLLQEMKRYGIRGNALVLNKILECFCRSGQWNEFRALRQTMKKRGILVFDEYREL